MGLSPEALMVFDNKITFPRLHEETLRDGIQDPSARRFPTPEEAVELFELARQVGTPSADIGFPVAGDNHFERASKILQYNASLTHQVDCSCASRMREDDIIPISNLSQQVGLPLRVDAFIGTDPLRISAQQWNLEEMLHWTEKAILFAKQNNLEIMMVTETTFEGIRKLPAFMESLHLAALRLGADRICLCDTTGSETPESVKAGIHWMRQLLNQYGFSHIPLDYHGHNDLDLSVANTLAAFQAGIDRGHVTILGLGERAGNTDRTTLQLILRSTGIDKGAFDLTKLRSYVNRASQIFGVPIPPKYPGLGEFVRSQTSGPHAHATLQALNNLPPEQAAKVYLPGPLSEWLGLESTHTTNIGPMAGKANVKLWVHLNLGGKIAENLSDDVIAKILRKAKVKDAFLTDNEIQQLLQPYLR